MAAKTRTKIQIEDDRRQIAGLYLRGKQQQAIADELGMTRQMVGYDLKAIQKRWREDTSRDLDADKIRELAKLDELERTYWKAWEDSSMGNRQGHPAFLRGVLDCVDRRCKLLGLDAPAKVDAKVAIPRSFTLNLGVGVLLDPESGTVDQGRIIEAQR